MPALLERPKMTRTMYEALKRHIMKERDKIKQEQEQDAMIERLRKERELKKKKEEEEAVTLEQTKEQLQQLEQKLEQLKKDKHQLFNQLKKVLNQEDETRRRTQMKDQSEMLSMQQQGFTHHSLASTSHPGVMLQASHISSRPTLYKPMMPAGIKRGRSPSPPPQTNYPSYHSEAKYAYTPSKASSSAHLYAQHGPSAEFKMGSYQQPQVSQAYATQASHSYVQQPAVTSFPGSQVASVKYSNASQSAFGSYPAHYGGHQQQGMPSGGKSVPEGFTAGYALQRLPQQPGYHTSQHSTTLQHQLEQKSSFAEDKYKMTQSAMRSMGAQQGVLMSQAMQMQQQPSKGSIVTGIPGAATSSYQPSSTSNTYQTAPGSAVRASYGGQTHNNRYYQ